MLQDDIKNTVRMALSEDLGGSVDLKADVSSQLIDENDTEEAIVITREAGVFCGRSWVDEVYAQLGAEVEITWFVKDGQEIEPGEQLFSLKGNARAILSGERTALNFVMVLSGVASKVSRFVRELEGTSCSLLDTRKTVPCMRAAQKYAVTCGGGKNNRMGLYDMFFLRRNHFLAVGGIEKAIELARAAHPELKVEVEVSDLDELAKALDAHADIISLDNFDFDTVVQAVKQTDHKALLEISGNVNIDTIKRFALTGVDFISVGAVTKNITALDLSLRFVQKPKA